MNQPLDILQDFPLRLLPETFNGPHTPFPGCFFQVLETLDLECVIEGLDFARTQSRNLEDLMQARRKAVFEFLQLGQPTGANNFPDFFIELFPDTAQLRQIAFRCDQIGDAVCQAGYGSGGVAVSPNPEWIGALDLQKISDFREIIGNLAILNHHHNQYAPKRPQRMVDMRPIRKKARQDRAFWRMSIAGSANFLSLKNKSGIRMSECQDSQGWLSPFAPDPGSRRNRKRHTIPHNAYLA